MTRYLLEVKNLTKKFGGIVAVKNLSFNLEEKKILGVIGPNGSGKTTLFNLISGYYKCDEGSVYFKGERISGLRQYQIAQKGIGRTFQITKIFGRMTALENMMVAPTRGEGGVDRALELLQFFDLIRLKNEYAEKLSYGQQKLLELARALMSNPQLLLLDEPAAGINPVLTEKLLDYIKKLRAGGKTFIIIEHNIRVISKLSDETMVLNYGEKIAQGKEEDIRRNKKVIDAYLGA